MDEDRFEEILSEGRFSRCSKTENFNGTIVKETLEYKPYLECPRCSNWQLAARVRKERDTKGFILPETVWRPVNRWWECGECAGTFDVTPTEELEDDTGGKTDEVKENTDDANEETNNANGTQELYKLDLVDKGGSSMQIPVDGGEKGIVRRRSNIVRVPAVSAKFRLPLDKELPTGTEVRIMRRDNDVYCIEE